MKLKDKTKITYYQYGFFNKRYHLLKLGEMYSVHTMRKIIMYYYNEEEVTKKCSQNETSELYKVFKVECSEDRFWYVLIAEFPDLASAQNLINTLDHSLNIFISSFTLNKEDNTLTTNMYCNAAIAPLVKRNKKTPSRKH